MGLFGPKKSAQEKYDEKEAKALKKRYAKEIAAFLGEQNDNGREFFARSVKEIAEACRPYENSVSRPHALDAGIDETAWRLQERFGDKGCLYAYVLFAEQMPHYAPYMKDLILDCSRRGKQCQGSFKLEFPTRVLADEMASVCEKEAKGTLWEGKVERFTTNTFVKSRTLISREEFHPEGAETEDTLFHRICRACAGARPDVPFTGSCAFSDRAGDGALAISVRYEDGSLAFEKR